VELESAAHHTPDSTATRNMAGSATTVKSIIKSLLRLFINLYNRERQQYNLHVTSYQMTHSDSILREVQQLYRRGVSVRVREIGALQTTLS
jgi:hypothetical protein